MIGANVCCLVASVSRVRDQLTFRPCHSLNCSSKLHVLLPIALVLSSADVDEHSVIYTINDINLNQIVVNHPHFLKTSQNAQSISPFLSKL
ncbi:hypothetical protein TNCV_602111 [Trichonephila clavipes]|nr:hypothetical protein TNCV_602111 [Trichonephila clavipes]